MAPIMGKRKYRGHVDSPTNIPALSSVDIDLDEVQTLFRQHFESTFEPIESKPPQSSYPANNEIDEHLVSSESDWDGLSENGDSEKPTVVVQDSRHRSARAEATKEEMKRYMTAKPPSADSKTASGTKKRQNQLPESDAVDTDAANLKKDLALQRLLKESHLLTPQSSLSHTGQNRHKALDLRLQDMGSKSSIFKQQNMPLTQRKGILAKSAEREDTRRRQAQENGIILEKVTKGKRRDSNKRQRGIGAPNIGKFQGGMLKLSKKDVADIEGPKKVSRGRR